MDPLSLHVGELVDKVKTGELKAADVASACIARIETLDPRVRSFLAVSVESISRSEEDRRQARTR
jgi:Asp-tRNA(Asn)/Glu-tRNA(Gln) amidotransferase A subunit family amidase